MKHLSLLFTILVIFCQRPLAIVIHESPAFEIEVSGQGAPLFLIPGATCSGKVWQSTVALLSQQYDCHVFTLAGYAGVEPLENSPFIASRCFAGR